MAIHVQYALAIVICVYIHVAQGIMSHPIYQWVKRCTYVSTYAVVICIYVRTPTTVCMYVGYPSAYNQLYSPVAESLNKDIQNT